MQVDEQLALLQHEKVDLLKRLEEDQEDLNELMKKHKALIAQVRRSSSPPPYMTGNRRRWESRPLTALLSLSLSPSVLQ